MQQPHDFRERLAFSQNASHEAFWGAVYRKAFPGMVGNIITPNDTASQLMGVDRLLYLSNNHVLRIDEKKRDSVYPDILLEYLSNSKTGSPGWIEKDLAIDYLAYAFMPTRKVYLLPWQILRVAWETNKRIWKSKHKEIRAQNKGYVTISVAVPTREVMHAIAYASIVHVSEADMRMVPS